MKEQIKQQKQNYVDQLKQVEASIKKTTENLTTLERQMEQLKGAIFAMDQLSLSAESYQKDKPKKKDVEKAPAKKEENK